MGDVWDHEVFEALVATRMQAAEYTMECSEVVGRRVEDEHDHAAWAQGGGCSTIIDAPGEGVATPPTPPTRRVPGTPGIRERDRAWKRSPATGVPPTLRVGERFGGSN